MNAPERPEPTKDSHTEAHVDVGGDPVCWLYRVCPECGRFSEVEPPTLCANCGAEIPIE